MKRVEAGLSVRKDLKSSFNYRGGPVMLVQAYVCAGKSC